METIIEKESDYWNALKIQELFPNISNNMDCVDVTLESRSLAIKESVDKPDFSKYANATIVKFLRYALRGGVFENEFGSELEIKPLMEDYKKIMGVKSVERSGFKKMRETTGHIDWTDNEKKFILNLYRTGITPKKIYEKYTLENDFTLRSHDAISSFLDESRREGLVEKLNIDWDNEIGFDALALFKLIGKDKNYLKLNAESLDDYYYDGTGVITRQKLNNFYRRIKDVEEKFVKWI